MEPQTQVMEPPPYLFTILMVDQSSHHCIRHLHRLMRLVAESSHDLQAFQVIKMIIITL